MTAVVRSDLGSSDIRYEIQGSFDGVTLEVNNLLGRYPPPGYGTWFNWPPWEPGLGAKVVYMAPKQLDNGEWLARGYRQTSCD